MFSDIRRAVGKTDSVEKGIELGALAEMRPVVMACAAAGLDHLPTGHSISDPIAGEFLLSSKET